METRAAVMSIIVEDPDSVEPLKPFNECNARALGVALYQIV